MTSAVAAGSALGLQVFRDPEAVTVVGASADHTKWGYWLARGALAGHSRRSVHLVNRNGGDIDGHPSIRSLDDIDGPLGLVVLVVPPSSVSQVVDEALALGALGFLGITAGLDRALERPGAERELATKIRSAGARMIGPNCLGIYDAATDLHLAWGEFIPGSIGIVSQSGQIGSELSVLAAEHGMGVSRFVSVGNQVDVDATEHLTDLVDHDRTRVVVLYVESFAEGRDTVEAMRSLREVGKHVIVLTVGASEASRTAAQSHTGSLTSNLDVVDAACRAAGAVRVATPAEAVEVAQMLLAAPLPAGRRVAVVGDSGGQGAVAADVLGAHGLHVMRFPSALRQRLEGMLPAEAGLANPVDLAGGGEQDLHTYADVVDMVAASPEVDVVLLTGYFGSYSFHTPALGDQEKSVARRLAEVPRRYGKPVVLHSMCRDSVTIELARRLGLPTYHAVEHAAVGLNHAARAAEQSGRLRDVPALAAGPGGSGYLAARAFLTRAGVSFPDAVPVRSRDDVGEAAVKLSGPLVLKADWPAHKTEAGGVAMGLGSAEEAMAAFDDMFARLGPGQYVLEQMDVRGDVVELIVGARRDPSFGPVVVVGAGGTQAELFRDTSLELAPVDHATALAMLRRLHSYPLLAGWRGRPGVDEDAIADVVVSVSRLAAASPVAELEINPLRAAADGALAVDALALETEHTTTYGHALEELA